MSVEGDFDAVEPALKTLSERLIAGETVKLYAVTEAGRLQAVTLTSINLQTGQVDFTGGGSLLRSGTALFDLVSPALNPSDNEYDFDLRETDEPVLRLARGMEAFGQTSGTQRFEVI